jgi:hypothetical protein
MTILSIYLSICLSICLSVCVSSIFIVPGPHILHLESYPQVLLLLVCFSDRVLLTLPRLTLNYDLPTSESSWNYRCVLPHPALCYFISFFFINIHTSSLSIVHSINSGIKHWLTSKIVIIPNLSFYFSFFF